LNKPSAPQSVPLHPQAEPARPSDPPDWNKIEQELTCPLCDYNQHVWADGPLLAGAYFLYAALSLPILYWGVTSWRMYVAYKRYLQFRHALSTTLIVQFMLLLLGTTIFAVWFSFRT
jgi:hypothetical protein